MPFVFIAYTKRALSKHENQTNGIHVMRLQPDERMQLTLMSKELNRQGIRLHPATLNLNFAETFKYTKSDAYQRLIIDAVQSNSALFTHRDEVEQAWGWIDPIIEAWESQNIEPQHSPSGNWGPEQAEAWFEPA